MAVVRGSSAIPVGGSFNPAGNVPLDARLWVDTIDDLKELVDAEHNYANPTIYVGAIIYVEDENKYYSVLGENNNVVGYSEFTSSENIVYIGSAIRNSDNDIITPKINQLWVDDDDYKAAEDYHNSVNSTETGIISTLQRKINVLEETVNKLSYILKYGALAGDSSIGGRTNIMQQSPVFTDPNTDVDEDADEIAPPKILATIPNIAIKHDTADNFNKNLQNLVDGELIWIQSTDQGILQSDYGLYIYSAKVGNFIKIGAAGGGNLPTNPTDDPTKPTSSITLQDDILNITGPQQNIYVDENGTLVISNLSGIDVIEDILNITTGTSTNTPGGNNQQTTPTVNVDVDNVLNITSNAMLFVNEDGYLEISSALLDNDKINL